MNNLVLSCSIILTTIPCWFYHTPGYVYVWTTHNVVFAISFHFFKRTQQESLRLPTLLLCKNNWSTSLCIVCSKSQKKFGFVTFLQTVATRSKKISSFCWKSNLATMWKISSKILFRNVVKSIFIFCTILINIPAKRVGIHKVSCCVIRIKLGQF